MFRRWLAVLLGAVLVLRLMGRSWWCGCGSWSPWWGDIHSSHNSQHLIDPYTLTHVLHGMLLFGALRILLRQVAPHTRFLTAVGLEALWEVVENTGFVIDRYRQSAVSLNYYGDSIFNSVGDLLACTAGYLLASRLPAKVSVAVFVSVELFLYLWIRDGLLLACLALFFPQKP
ncbi:MAG: DUF2585 family protein [Candidatus Eremiobacterota bacterium]